MTLWPSARRPGVAPRNAHTSSSSVRHNVGNSRHVVFALTTAVGHSAVRSMVTSYAITVLRWCGGLAARHKGDQRRSDAGHYRIDVGGPGARQGQFPSAACGGG